MTTPYPIIELYAWIADDPERKHAIMGVMTAFGPMQAVSSKLENMERPEFQQTAETIAKETGITMKLQRFAWTEDMKVIKP